MEARQAKGLEIAANSEITREGNIYIVRSETSSKKYDVNIFIRTCTCAYFEAHRSKCKHLYAVENMLLREAGAPPVVPEKVVRPTYKQEWREYTQAQVNEKAKFLELLFALCSQIDEPVQHMGRPRITRADRIFACCFKIYSTLSGRRFMSDLMEAKRRGYVSQMPTYSAIYRYLESEELTPILKELIIESSLPLKAVEFDFAVDSSGFSTGRYDHWVDTKWDKEARKYGEDVTRINKKDWLKVHLMCGCTTNIVTSVEVTHAHAADTNYFGPLVEQTSQNFAMNSVCADKAYSSAKNLYLVQSKAAMPYIDFKGNTRPSKKSPSIWKRMFHLYNLHQAEFMRHYHKRSNVEATFSMVKRKFGERLRSKTHTAQVNELLCKILAHNLCCVIQSIYELKIDVDFGA